MEGAKIRPGDLVKIIDNGRIVSHITPQWALGEFGEVVRLNDLSVTVLIFKYDKKIRVNYYDIQIVSREARNET